MPEIVIDARALTMPHFAISGGPPIRKDVLQAINLAPGAHRFGTLVGPSFEFTVRPDGTVEVPSDGVATGGSRSLAVHGVAVAIDATPLTMPSFWLLESTTALTVHLPTRTVQSLRLLPGPYRFGTLAGSVFEFEVRNAPTGPTIHYHSRLEAFLDGDGRATLTVQGLPVDIDATRLTMPSFWLMDTATALTSHLPTTVVQHVRLIPGSYRFGTLVGSTFEFQVTETGTIGYHESLETFLSGVGGSELVVDGFRISIDATRLTMPSFWLTDVGTALTAHLATTAVQEVVLIPGRYQFGTLVGSVFQFQVSEKGRVGYEDRLRLFLSGAGSTTLIVEGFPIDINATYLTMPSFWLTDVGTALTVHLPTTAVQAVRLIPGRYHFGTLVGSVFEFGVTDAGTVSYAISLESFLSEAGTATLVVDGFMLSVDATALTAATFTIGDVGTALQVTFPTSRVRCMCLIPGRYSFSSGFQFEFVISGSGRFEFDAGLGPCVEGANMQRLRVTCDPSRP